MTEPEASARNISHRQTGRETASVPGGHEAGIIEDPAGLTMLVSNPSPKRQRGEDARPAVEPTSH
jgi:hypothetical protein